MAKKESNFCKKCEKSKKECTCPERRRYGLYGLDVHDRDDHDGETPVEGGMTDGGAMGEAIKMPKAPGQKELGGMSSDHKKKKLQDFRAQVDDAKKRQSDQKRKDDLYMTRKKRGIKFYDAKGSGYIKDGKKQYD